MNRTNDPFPFPPTRQTSQLPQPPHISNNFREIPSVSGVKILYSLLILNSSSSDYPSGFQPSRDHLNSIRRWSSQRPRMGRWLQSCKSHCSRPGIHCCTNIHCYSHQIRGGRGSCCPGSRCSPARSRWCTRCGCTRRDNLLRSEKAQPKVTMNEILLQKQNIDCFCLFVCVVLKFRRFSRKCDPVTGWACSVGVCCQHHLPVLYLRGRFRTRPS